MAFLPIIKSNGGYFNTLTMTLDPKVPTNLTVPGTNEIKLHGTPWAGFTQTNPYLMYTNGANLVNINDIIDINNIPVWNASSSGVTDFYTLFSIPILTNGEPSDRNLAVQISFTGGSDHSPRQISANSRIAIIHESGSVLSYKYPITQLSYSRLFGPSMNRPNAEFYLFAWITYINNVECFVLQTATDYYDSDYPVRVYSTEAMRWYVRTDTWGGLVGGSTGYSAPIIKITDPNQQDEDGTNVEGGGGGTYHRIYESVPIPGLPTIGPGYAGSFRSFVLTNAEMRSFNEIMYGPTAWQAIKAYFTNPMDFFIGCLALPFYPSTLGRGKPVFNGTPDYVWDESYQMLADDWYELSCGSIDIQEYYGSCFDYDPYTSIQLWLPFIGYVSLSPDEVMGKTVGVTYHISVCTGDCVAFVHTGVVGATGPQIPRVIGQFNGNCAMQIPVVQTSFDAVIQSSMEMAAQVAAIAAGAVTGGAGLIAAEEAGASQAVFESRAVAQAGKSASQLAGATMSAVAGSKTKFAKNGGMAGAAGFMGVLKPHLVISTPRQSLPDNYINLKGYPSNISGTIGDFDGYLEVTDVRLNDIPATIAEIEEIYAQLKGGIII